MCGASRLGTSPESYLGSSANDPARETRLQREIDATDRQIDHLVYELYGLKEDEITVVETDDESRSRPFAHRC